VLHCTYDEALQRVPEALKSEGFGVLTEVDVQSTLKQKLGVDIRRYKILGACNPGFAHKALSIELEAGLMMPCNVIVYEGDDRRATVVAVDPTQTVAAGGNRELAALAAELRTKLARAVDQLA
jgi:uncharacterized protein (DUF302 family)